MYVTTEVISVIITIVSVGGSMLAGFYVMMRHFRSDMKSEFASANARNDEKFEQVDRRFEQVDRRFEQVDKRFEQVDKRFEQVDKRFEQVDEQFKEVRAELRSLNEDLAQVRVSVAKIEGPPKRLLTSG